MGLVNDIEKCIKHVLALDIEPSGYKKEQHPATIQEMENMAATIIFFESIKNMHNRMVANRQHEEMMDELQRIGR